MFPRLCNCAVLSSFLHLPHSSLRFGVSFTVAPRACIDGSLGIITLPTKSARTQPEPRHRNAAPPAHRYSNLATREEDGADVGNGGQAGPD